MAKDHSFDIVSVVDTQEVTNAVDQSRKEVAQRYDFKGSDASLDWNHKEMTITLLAENDMRLHALNDILQSKMAKRGVSLKALEYKDAEKASAGQVRQLIKIQSGIPSEKAKQITKSIKQSKIKVQAQIQQDQIRVSAGKIDLLQEAIQYIKGQDYGLELQFENYR